MYSYYQNNPSLGMFCVSVEILPKNLLNLFNIVNLCIKCRITTKAIILFKY